MRKRPRILTLIIVTLLPCALLTLRWYSFRAFDYLLWLRGTTGYSIVLSDGTVQLESATDFCRTIKSSPDEIELIAGSLIAGHSFDQIPRRAMLRRVLSLLNDDDSLIIEPPAHDWHAFAFGFNSHRHGVVRMEIELHRARVAPAAPPPTIVHYLQLPLWPLIALTTLLVLRKWWHL